MGTLLPEQLVSLTGSMEVSMATAEAVAPNTTNLGPHTAQRTRGLDAATTFAQFETLKHTITDLYLDSNWTLGNIMEHMSQVYGFQATTKQYKAKLGEWKLEKNLRRPDIIAILHLQRARDAIGKKSKFQLRGRPVEFSKVMKAAKRCRISLDASGPSDMASSIDAVVVTTPPPSPPLSTPWEDDTRFLLHLRDFSNSTMANDSAMIDLAWAEPCANDIIILNSFIDYTQDGQLWQADGHSQLAFMWWRKSCLQLEMVLSTWNRMTLLRLFREFQRLEDHVGHEVARIMKQCITDLASVRFDPSDPRRRLLESFSLTARASYPAHNAILDLMESFGEPWSSIAFEHRLACAEAQLATNVDMSIEPAIPTVEAATTRYGELGGRTLQVLYRRARIFAKRNNHMMAENIALALLNRSNQLLGAADRLWYASWVHSRIARSQFCLEKLDLARVNALASIVASEEHKQITGFHSLTNVTRVEVTRVLMQIAEKRGDDTSRDSLRWRIDSWLKDELEELEELEEDRTRTLEPPLVSALDEATTLDESLVPGTVLGDVDATGFSINDWGYQASSSSLWAPLCANPVYFPYT